MLYLLTEDIQILGPQLLALYCRFPEFHDSCLAPIPLTFTSAAFFFRSNIHVHLNEMAQSFEFFLVSPLPIKPFVLRKALDEMLQLE